MNGEHQRRFDNWVMVSGTNNPSEVQQALAEIGLSHVDAHVENDCWTIQAILEGRLPKDVESTPRAYIYGQFARWVDFEENGNTIDGAQYQGWVKETVLPACQAAQIPTLEFGEITPQSDFQDFLAQALRGEA